jgi:Putative transposase
MFVRNVAEIRPSHTTAVAIVIATSARRRHVIDGSRRASRNCFKPVTSTSSSRCLTSCTHSLSKTRPNFTTCCSARSLKRSAKLHAIPSISGRRLVSSAFSIPGGQNVLFHPHIHCVIPGGGISPNRDSWIHPKYPFFLPVKALAKVFRGKFVAGLRNAHRKKRLTCAGSIQHLANAKCFAAFLRTLFRQDWIVYAKPAFGGPAQVIRYLGRYTHRVAISNHRLVSFDGDHVTFRWRDYAGGNKTKTMTISGDEFIRRFLLRVLPKGFVRIRHFGVMANYNRSESIALCRKLLAMIPLMRSPESRLPNATWLCPRCRARMIVILRLTAAQLFWMSSAVAFADSS